MNSIPTKEVSPRITIFAAIDTQGRSFMALTTAKTTSEVVCLFLKGLATKLGRQDAQFKEKTVFQFDSASYHHSLITRNYLANLGIKTVICGPYGYDMAPVELFFAALKSTDINPDHVKTGKK